LLGGDNSLRQARSIYGFKDGDGRSVKSETRVNRVLTETVIFVGAHYEIANPGSGQTVTKYYFAGAQRIAMRKSIIPQSSTLTYLLGDHPSTSLTLSRCIFGRTSLGSTSLAVDTSTGEVRYTTPNKTLPTK
jgi:hypothetical protein